MAEFGPVEEELAMNAEYYRAMRHYIYHIATLNAPDAEQIAAGADISVRLVVLRMNMSVRRFYGIKDNVSGQQ